VAVESSQVIKLRRQLAAVFRTVRGSEWIPRENSALQQSRLSSDKPTPRNEITAGDGLDS